MVTLKSKVKSTSATICCTPVYTTHLMIKPRLIQSNQHTIHSQEEPRENKESTGHHSLQQKTVKHTQAINVMVQRAMAVDSVFKHNLPSPKVTLAPNAFVCPWLLSMCTH